MPNRVLRDWTDSETIDTLTAQGERFFTRLIMKVDDFGRYTSNIKLLKSTLFPLKTDIREADISLWLTECEKCGLIALYTVAQKGYLQIINFKQTLRTKTGKYPPPEGCTASEPHLHSNCSADAPLKRNEIETETETKRKNAHAKSLVLEPIEIQRRLIEEEFSVAEFIQQTYGLTEIQYQNSVKLFVGEKTAGHNELEKDFSDVLRHFKSWVRFNSDKLKRSAGPEKGKQSKVDDFLTAHKGAQSILDAENN